MQQDQKSGDTGFQLWCVASICHWTPRLLKIFSSLPSSVCWLFVHRLTNLNCLSHFQTSCFTCIQKSGGEGSGLSRCICLSGSKILSRHLLQNFATSRARSVWWARQSSAKESEVILCGSDRWQFTSRVWRGVPFALRCYFSNNVKFYKDEAGNS